MRSIFWYALAAALSVVGLGMAAHGVAYGCLVLIGGLLLAVLTRLLRLKPAYRPS
jgi:hypothetical protein